MLKWERRVAFPELALHAGAVAAQAFGAPRDHGAVAFHESKGVALARGGQAGVARHGVQQVVRAHAHGRQGAPALPRSQEACRH